MTTETKTEQKSTPAHQLSSRLSRDVTSILATCLHHFEEVEREIKESTFDVDAVIAGRFIPTRTMYYNPVTPPESRREVPVPASAYSYRAPQKGSFIPSSHFGFRAA